MTVLNPRNRTISVRLSEEEYAALRRLCLITGARSVSDFTRDSMRVLLKGAKKVNGLGLNADEFRLEIGNLNKKLEQLAAEIATSKTENTND